MDRAGSQLGPYLLESLLGAGGMGEVYRARDTRLGRDVAIKISAEHFGERFEREARAVAALNHPNICTLHDIGPNYLVMELVEGSTLAERIRQGPLPLKEALRIALQIADALEAAHERGIVHRDLKPANIKVKPDGTVKVLDFGLAQVSGVGDATATLSLTAAGTIVGTAAYMAPEQAEGKPVDRRADVWAFGVVLYEMLTGQRLFDGNTFSTTLAAVLTKQPELKSVPRETHRLLQRCLEKDPRRRLGDIGEARFLLEEPLPPAVLIRTPLVPWIIAGTLGLALAVAVWAPWRGTSPSGLPVMRLSVDLGPEALPSRTGAAISPDGTLLAFIARGSDGQPQLATRRLEQAKPMLLPDTLGASDPFFSPDGQWIGFLAGSQIKKTPALGGAVVTICSHSGAFGASWGDDQNIVFANGPFSPLMRVPASGGTPETITKVGELGDGTHRWPQVLPSSKAVLFTSHKIVTGFDDARIDAVITATGQRKTVLRGGYFARYLVTGAGNGYLIYVHEGVLFGVPFDPAALEVRGTPTPLVDDVAGDSDIGAGRFDVSGSVLLFRGGKGPARKWPIQWLESSGITGSLIPEPGAYYAPRFSPDGTRLALTLDMGDHGREIHVYDLQRQRLTRLTFNREVNLFPIWTPDGKYILYESSSPKGGYGIGVVRADGSPGEHRLNEHAGLMIPRSFTPDGRWVAYNETNPQTAFDIWVLPFDTSDPEHPKAGPPEPIANTSFSESGPAFSPDGRWLAYSSNESGRVEVHVRPFHRTGGKWQVSNGGGSTALWSPTGREIFFRGPDARIMVTEYNVNGDSFTSGKPRVWSDTPVGLTPFGNEFTLGPDGKRFAIIPRREAPEQTGSVHLTFLVNFLGELERKMGKPATR